MKNYKIILFSVVVSVLVFLRFIDFAPMVKLFGNPDTYIEKGNMYMAEMDYAAAFKEYDNAIIANENYAKAYAKRGDVYRSLKDYEKSKLDYEKALSLDSDCLEALEGLYFSNIIDLNNEDFNSYREKQDKLNNKIMELCNRLIENNSNDPDVYLTRARHYSNRDTFRSQIINDYNKALALAPNDSRIYLSRAYTWQLYKEYDKAIEDIQKALSLEPHSSNAYLSWGAIYEDKKEYEKAIEIYFQGMEFAKKKGSFLSRIGRCYNSQGDEEKAIEYSTKAVESDPKDESLYEARGHIYWNQQEYDLALEDFNTALNLNPNNKSIKSAISHIEKAKEDNFVRSRVKKGRISDEIEGLWVSDTVSTSTGFPNRIWNGKPISGMPYDLFSSGYYLHGIMIAKDGDNYRVDFVRDEFQSIDPRGGDYIEQIKHKMEPKNNNYWAFGRKEMVAQKNGDSIIINESKIGTISVNHGPEQDMSVSLILNYDTNAKTLKITQFNEKQGGVTVPPENTHFEYDFSKNHTYHKMAWNEYIALKNDIWNKGIEKIKSGVPLRN